MRTLHDNTRKFGGQSSHTSTQRSIRTLRFVVLVCLIITAILVGWGSFYFLRQSELRREREQFSSLTRKIVESTYESRNNKISALMIIGAAVAQHNPDVSKWPYVSLRMRFFESLSVPATNIAKMTSVSFAPIINVTQISAFENYAYDFFARNRHPEVGLSDFGRGIFGVNQNGKRYRINFTNDQNPFYLGDYYNSSYKILTPLINVSKFQKNRILLLNTYAEAKRAQAIDEALNCSIFATVKNISDCVSISPIIHLYQDTIMYPSSLMVLPVILDFNASFNTRSSLPRAKGIITTAHGWANIFDDASYDVVNGIDIIVQSNDLPYCFRVRGGKTTFHGQYDCHDSSFDDRSFSFAAAPPTSNAKYYVHVYPSNEWMSAYLTFYPFMVMAITIFIILITSLLVFFYDKVVKLKAREQELVLKTKRQFIRYISHEIRTPMNTVHLGVRVLEVEIARILESVKDRPFFKRLQEKLREEFPGSAHQSVISQALHSNSNGSNGTEESRGRGGGVEKTMRDWLVISNDIEVSSDAAITVLNDLINYDKLETGQLNIEIKEIDIWSTVRDAVNAFTAQAKHANINLQLDMQVDAENEGEQGEHRSEYLRSLVVIGDSVKIVQAFRTIIANVLKFTTKFGNVQVKVAEYLLSIVYTNPEGLPDVQYEDIAKKKRTEELKRSSCPTSCLKRRKSSAEKNVSRKDQIENIRRTRAGSVVITVHDGANLSAAADAAELLRDDMQFDPNKLQSGSGSGLGLFISKGIVKLHKGLLTSTTDGRGIDFIIELPLFLKQLPDTSKETVNAPLATEVISHAADLNAVQKVSEDIEGHVAGNESATATVNMNVDAQQRHVVRRILVVDDSQINRKMLCKLLKMANYTTVEASDGIDCLQQLNSCNKMSEESEKVDLVLMDHEMPRMNGPDAAKLISQYNSLQRQQGGRGTRAGSRSGVETEQSHSLDLRFFDSLVDYAVPVIGVTGNVLQEDQDFFMQCGARRVLSKPITITKLEEAIQSINSGVQCNLHAVSEKTTLLAKKTPAVATTALERYETV